MRRLFVLISAFALASCATVEPAHETSVDSQALEADVRVLASDAMEGREAGTRGYQMASDYVADRYAAIGLKHGGEDGTYFQPVGLELSTYGGPSENTLDLSGQNAPADLVAMRDYIVTPIGSEASGMIEAPLVFVGQGYVDPARGRDDLAGIDLTGKIAVAFYGAPSFLGSEERANFSSQRSIAIAKAGAIGLLTLPTPAFQQRITWDKMVQYTLEDTDATWIGPDGKGFRRRPNMRAYANLTEDLARRIMANQPLDYDQALAITNDPDGRFVPHAMGMTAKMRFKENRTRGQSRNVIGLIPGSDPALRDEYLILTAHLDHLGVIPTPEEGDDEIYNGAMDNALGVAIMIDVARRLAAEPPRRSVLVIALTAEESGLIGSSYNAHYPTVPAGQIVANLNLDMPILTWDFADIVAFGAERSTLFPAVEAAASRAGVALSPDPLPEEGLFARSDQYSYVKQGIPATYLKPGFANGGEQGDADFRKNHYHKPSDEADLIDFTQANRFADLNYEIARQVADMDQRPVWKKGDPFGTAFGGPMEQ